MKQTVRKLTGNDMVRHNAVFFVGSIAVGTLNFLLYPILSRQLNVKEFGEVQVLINLLIQIAIFTNVVSLFVVNIATNLKKISEIRTFIETLESLTMALHVVLVAILIAVSPVLANRLQYESAIPFWGVALFLLCNVPVSIRVGYLRSQQDFARTSWAQIIQSALRLLFGVGAAAIGLGVAGVMFGVAGSTLCSGIYVLYAANKLNLHVNPLHAIRWPSLKGFQAQGELLRPTVRYMGLIAAVSFSIICILSIDSIIAKYVFSPDQAGMYGGLAVAARIVFFGTSSVAGVLASRVKVEAPKNENIKALLFSLGLTIGMGGIACLLFVSRPELFVRLLVGNNFADFAPLLIPLSLGVFCNSVLNVLFTYHVAVRDTAASFMALGATIIVGLSVYLNRTNPDTIAQGFLNGSILSLAIGVIWTTYWHKGQRTLALQSGGGGHP